MTRSIRIFTCLLFVIGSLSHVNAQDESKEPPQKFRLLVDGKPHTASEGAPLKISGAFTNPTITIHVEPTREFSYGGVRFSYPQAYTFEADITDPATKTWTLSGNDAKVTYSIIAADSTVDDYLAAIIEQFGKKNCSQAKAIVDLGGTKHEGARLNVKLAGHQMTLDIVQLAQGKTSKFVTLQDSPTEAGKPSAEAVELLKLLKTNFKQLK